MRAGWRPPPWSAGLALSLFLLAPAQLSAAEKPEDRLDAALKLLYRAQRGSATAAAPAQRTATGRDAPVHARDLIERLRGREGSGQRRVARADGFASAEPRLTLFVKYDGPPQRLAEAGFAIQARAGNIYTGTLSLASLATLAELAGVRSVQTDRLVHASALPARAGLPALRPLAAPRAALTPLFSPPPPPESGGAGVLVAFVDTGVDVFHDDFRRTDGTTRIKYLLDFSDPGDTDGDGVLDGAGPFGGTLYSEADINAALTLSGVVNEKDVTGHGTHGLSIAAGDDPAQPGMAPDADLIVVKATRDGTSLAFGSADVVNALSFVDQKATELGQPFVVNLSLGTLISSHDGRSLEEQAIDLMFGPGRPGKVAVAAAGNSSDNSGTSFRHFMGTAHVGLTRTHTLVLPAYTPNAGQGNDRAYLNLWYEGRDKLDVIVTPPGCPAVGAVYGSYADVDTACGSIFIANLGGANPDNGAVEAVIVIDDWKGTEPLSGDWTLSLQASEVGDSGEYHAWLSDDSKVGEQTAYLSGNADNLYLVGKPGAAFNVITVGSFAKHDAASRFRTSWTDAGGVERVDDTAVDGALSSFSSPGRTRDRRIKPEVTAPGERVLGAVSRDAIPGVSSNSIYRFKPAGWPDNALLTDESTNHAFGLLQGTSFSAPVVTGLAARILASNPALDAIQVRNVLVNSALSDTQTGAVPNDRWGYGKVDLAVGTGGGSLPPDVRILADSLPNAVLNEPFSFVFSASGGTLPYAWSLTSTAVPGLTLDSRGHLSGTPTSAGTYTVTVQLTDTSVPVQTTARSYSLVVGSTSQVSIVTTALPPAIVEKPYDSALEADGGTPPYSWSLAGGSPPPGLALTAAGRVQGTPTQVGRVGFTVRVEDSIGAAALKTVRLNVTREGLSIWDPLGIISTTVNEVTVDPNNTSHLMASTSNTFDSAQNAVFESTNAGESWQPVSVNNGLNDYASWLGFNPVSSVAWAVSNPHPNPMAYRYDAGARSWVVTGLDRVEAFDFDAAGTLYALVPPNPYSSTVPGTLMRSSDEGATWSAVGTLCTPVGGLSLSVHRPNPAYMYTTAGAGTCRSVDGGQTWTAVAGNGRDIQVSQQDPLDVMRAVEVFPNMYLERSLDGGDTWTRYAVPGSSFYELFRRAPSDPSVVVYGSSGSLARSTDGGQTWTLLPGQHLAFLGRGSIAFDPSDAARFYVASDSGLSYTGDGGQTFARKNRGLEIRALTGIAVSAANPTDLLLTTTAGDPFLTRTGGEKWTKTSVGAVNNTELIIPTISGADPSLYWVVTASGLRRSDNRGLTWTPAGPSCTFCSSSIEALDADPFDANNVVVGVFDEIHRSTNRGASWSLVATLSGFAGALDISFARDVPGRVYAAMGYGGLYRSTDGGATWQPFAFNQFNSSSVFSRVEPAPSNSSYVYAAAGKTIHFLDPSLGTWNNVSVDQSVLALAAAWNDPMVAYAGVNHPGTAGATGGLYKTTDGGRNWTRLAGVLDSFDVVGVATHPTAFGTVYAATRESGVFRSTDGGVTWLPLDKYGTIADLVNAHLVQPGSATQFAATEGYGVQVSTNGGASFAPLVVGLSNLNVNTIAFDPLTPTTLYAGTDAGIYKSTNSGSNWTPTAQSTGRVTDIVIDSDGATRLIWGTVAGQGVAFSNDGGVTFTVQSNGLASLDLTSLELENSGTTRLIWGTTRGGDGVVYSEDDGVTWQSAAGNGLTSRHVNDVKIQKGSTRLIWGTTRLIWGTTRVIWGTTDDGVFFSLDGAKSWNELSLGLPSGVPVTSMAIDPNTDEVFVSLLSDREGGVYRGANMNGVWSAFNDGLDTLRVRKVTNDSGRVLDATTSATTFFAATAGDGVYKNDVVTPAGNAPQIQTVAFDNGFLRVPYLQTLAVADGQAPYRWSLSEGSLPPGLRLDGETGVISGEPGDLGIFSFGIQVSDRHGRLDRELRSITILDPRTPALAVADVAVAEGGAGTAAAVFTITLSTAAGSDVTVNFATSNGTAIAGSDYQPVSGTLTFPAGTTSLTVSVPLVADGLDEPDETLFLDLSAPVNALLADAHGQCSILDADPEPVISIADAAVTEGASGTVNAVFNVTLSAASSRTVSVPYATAAGSATATADFTSSSGSLTFAPGTLAATISVPVKGDALDEDDEQFFVNLSAPTNATLGTSQGRGTIVDDDPSPSLTLGDVTVTEGATSVSFTVSLQPASGRDVSVNYATADGSATAGGDFTATNGSLTFSPGTTTKLISVPLLGDSVGEPSETLFVDLSAAAGATIADGQGRATILDDDGGVPTLSIGDVSFSEGGAPLGVVVTVTLSVASSSTVTVQYAMADGSAASGSDFTAGSGTLTFPPGNTSQTLTVATNGDATDEPDEAFFVNLSGAVNAEVADAQAAVTILDDDDPPALSIADASDVAEGDSGTVNAAFTVSLSAPSGKTVTVDFATADITATTTRTLTNPAAISIPALGVAAPYPSTISVDSLAGTIGKVTATLHGFSHTYPADVDVLLVGPSGQSVVLMSDTGSSVSGLSLTFDDAAPAAVPTVGLSSGTYRPTDVTPGDSFPSPALGGTRSPQLAAFNGTNPNGTWSLYVIDDLGGDSGSLSGGWSLTIRTAGGDYTTAAGTLTFPPGTTQRTLDVAVIGDGFDEPDETFVVNLTSPANATLADAQGQCVILDDDVAVPSLSIGDVAVGEGSATASFSVALSAASADTVTVAYATSPLSAGAGSDYDSVSGTLTFDPGTTVQAIVVPVLADALDEADETFSVTLSSPVNANVAVAEAQGTIVDDDATPALTIDDVSVSEGDASSAPAVFTVTLSAASGRTVTVDYATANGTALAPGDYASASGTLSFAPGVTSQSIPVIVNGDTTAEGDEAFYVNLMNAGAATLQDAQGRGAILNDDANAVPEVSVNDVSVTEGTTGSVNVTFSVSLSLATSQTVTVGYATADDTATAGPDYTATSGTLTFAPGVSSRSVVVTVAGDALDEVDEALFLNLTAPTNATLGDAQGRALILDNDPQPTLSIADVSHPEGDGGSSDAVFSVTLSAPSGRSVSVAYATANGTASANGDYAPTSGSLTFPPGTTTRTIAVPISGDTAVEPDETFLVNLSEPSGAGLGDAQGLGRILNDEGMPVISIGDATSSEGDAGTSNAVFNVTLSGASTQTVSVDYATANGTAGVGAPFTSPAAIAIPHIGSATPYPSTLVVPALGGTITKVKVTLDGFGHTWPSDVDALLVGPQGQTVMLMSDTGGSADAINLTLTFDDAGAPLTSSLTSGTYRPTDFEPGESLPSPAPSGSYGTSLAVFNGTAAAGTWKLYVNDDVGGDSGSIAGGFSLSFETTAGDFVASAGTLVFPPGTTTQALSIPINGDVVDEADEGFTVNLTAAVNAIIGDGQGVGTILDDDAAPALSISDVAMVEGNGGQSTAIFNVNLSAAGGQAITVDYATADSSAIGGGAIVPGAGSVSISASSTQASPYPSSLTVPSFSGTVTKVTATLTGFTHPWPFDVDILLVGPQGQKVMLLSDAGLAASDVSLTFDDNAPSAVPLSGTMVSGRFRPTDYEVGETLPAPAPAGPYGTQLSVFNGLDPVGTWTLYVAHDFLFSSGMLTGWTLTLETAGADYVPVSGTLTFAPGQMTQTVAVPVFGDTAFEPNETFLVNLANAVDAGIADGQATGTITNDDVVVSIAHTTVSEGNSGTLNASFAVSLSGAASDSVTVSWATANGTATSGGGSFGSSAAVAIPSSGPAAPYPSSISVPGSVGAITKVKVTLDDFSHTFPSDVDVLLVGPQGQKVLLMSDAGGSSAAVNATLTFDDAGAALTSAPITSGVFKPTDLAGYPDAFAGPAPVGPYQTALSAFAGTNPSGTWNLYIVDNVGGDSGSLTGWALLLETAGGDFAAASGTLTFPVGTLTQTIDVPVNGDILDEPDETFFVNLTGVSGASIVDGQGQATILDDDEPMPVLSIADVTAGEGAGTATFTATLSSASTHTVAVAYATSNGSAVAGADYAAASGTLTFSPGVTSQTIGVALTGDALDEADEVFTVTLANPTNATLGDATAIGTIADDDAPPALTINDVTVTEGNGGTTNAVFTVSLSAASSQTVSAGYFMTDVTAMAGTDYTSSTGTLTFAAGETTKAVNVAVIGDLADESNETFRVNLSAPSNATIAKAIGVGTIADDDSSIVLDRSVLRFGVVRSGPALTSVTPAQSVGLTLDAGRAWTATSNQAYVTVTPASGTGTGTISIGVVGHPSLPTSGPAQATITVSSPGALNTPQTIAVSVQVNAPGTTAAPFGSFDTPLENSTGLQGAFGITGWALDDVGVSKVEIWRSRVAVDPPPAPNGLIYIGDATIVSGARPDVEGIYSSYPRAYHTAWGYALLTNLLPNVNAGTTAGGVGTFTLYAYVYDVEGKLTILPARTFTCNNATGATKPFGTIDTPGQGETVSGTINNFGWALTPQAGTIPTNGSTITLFIDGIPRGTLTGQYNFPRSDLAGYFPGLNNTNGPVGRFIIDTTTLSNGVHTIAWSVTDNLGRAEGLGSRYFWVLN